MRKWRLRLGDPGWFEIGNGYAEPFDAGFYRSGGIVFITTGHGWRESGRVFDPHAPIEHKKRVTQAILYGVMYA